jgi:RES domain-containing protein
MAEQIFYRALRPAWSFKPLSGAGAAHNGGRWNAKGTPALYLAEDPMTALAEYNQDFSFRPVTLAQYRLKNARLADLRDPTFRHDQGIDDAAMSCAWYALSLQGLEVPSWKAATILANRGYHGLLYPSRFNGSSCLALWAWNDASGCTVTVSDQDGRLPRDDRSWSSQV